MSYRRSKKKSSGRPAANKNHSPKGKSYASAATENGKLDNTDFKRESKGDWRIPMNTRRMSDNDWRWYAPTEQLVRDFASFPFGIPLGTLLPSHGRSTTAANVGKTAIPGICALYFEPAIGYSTDETSAVNMAMRQLFSFVRKTNSGSTNYDAPDLMLNFIALDSLHMWLANLKRVYGVMTGTAVTNKYLAKHLVRMLGFSYESLQANLANFRGFINLLASRLAVFPIPNSVSYCTRHAWMAENVYTDSDSEKAQIYVYVPSGYYQFVLDENGAGGLNRVRPWQSAVDAPNAELTLDDIVAFSEQLLNPIIVNQDFNIMAGDILHAYGEAGIYKVTGIADNYAVLPTFNKEVLSQIENATVFSGSQQNHVRQSVAVGGGYLVSMPLVELNTFIPKTVKLGDNTDSVIQDFVSTFTYNLQGYKLINMHHDGVQPTDTIVATRLSNTIDLSLDWNLVPHVSRNFYYLQATSPTIGSEIVVNAAIAVFQQQVPSMGDLNLKTIEVTSVPAVFVNTTTVQVSLSFMNKFAEMMTSVAALENFDWNFVVTPTMVAAASTSSENMAVTASSSIMPLMDVDNYTILTTENLKNLADVALMGEFAMPMS